MNVARVHFFFLRILHIEGPRERVVLRGKIFEVTAAEASSIKKDVGLSWRPSSDKHRPRKGIDIAKRRGFYIQKEGALCNKKYNPASESQHLVQVSLPGND